jgi:AcrR family transcriptional regulator
MAATLRDRRRAELRDQIVLAALPLFAVRGFDAVTMDEIAEAAGISLSTLFRHVASKDDLLAGSVRPGGAMIVANFEHSADTEPVRRALARAILHRIEQFGGQSRTVRLWRRAMASAPNRVRRAALLDEDERRELIALVAARLVRSGPAGSGSDQSRADQSRAAQSGPEPGSELEAGVLVHMMLAAAEYAYGRWLDQPAGPSLHELTRQALELAVVPDGLEL